MAISTGKEGRAIGQDAVLWKNGDTAPVMAWHCQAEHEASKSTWHCQVQNRVLPTQRHGVPLRPPFPQDNLLNRNSSPDRAKFMNVANVIKYSKQSEHWDVLIGPDMEGFCYLLVICIYLNISMTGSCYNFTSHLQLQCTQESSKYNKIILSSVPYVGTTSNFQCNCTSYCIFVLPSSKLNGLWTTQKIFHIGFLGRGQLAYHWMLSMLEPTS
jgi:hypothetical protein